MNKRVIRIAGCWRDGSVDGAAMKAHTMALQAANFLRQISGGLWDVEGYGFAMDEQYWKIDTSAPRYGMQGMTATWNMLKDRPDLRPPGVPVPSWKPTHWHIFSNQYFPGQCGQHNFRGSVGRTNVGMGCGLNTMTHELGHGLGAMHSNVRLKVDHGRDPAGTVREYHDRTGTMGSAAPISNHVPHQFTFGLHLTDEVLRVTKNARFDVVPWEVPRRARRDDEWAYATIFNNHRFPESYERGGGKYLWLGSATIFVSTRKTKGYPWNIASKTPTLYIHILNGPESVLIDAIEVGESSKLIPGVTITHENTFTVVVEFEGDNTPVKDLSTGRGKEHWAPAPGSPPKQGVYWNPHMAGQGIDLQQGKRGPVMFWYTQTDDALPDWYVADIGDDGYGHLYTKYGLGEEPTYVGWVRLLEHEGVVHLDYHTDVHGKGSIEMQQLGEYVNSGMYWNPARDGEGFTLREMDDGQIAGWFYTFEKGRRVWYHLYGAMDNLKVYLAITSFIKHNVGMPVLELMPDRAVLTSLEDFRLNFKWRDHDTNIQVIK